MGLPKEIIKKITRTIARHKMINRGDHVVVAVSGGPDSVCLLDILNELKTDLGIQLIVAHFNHGLRPDEDENETGFVETLALFFGLPFETKRASNIMEGSFSTEEEARHARYQFLEEVKERFSARKIAVGHNLDDQAETVLMRLLRGSGTSGLAGIPPCRDNKIIRPLLEVTRPEIMSWLEWKKLKYISDSSNHEMRYLRNRIRAELVPLLKKYQPRIVEILGQTARIMRNDEALLEANARDWVQKKSRTGKTGGIEISLPQFIKIHDALKNRVIRYVLKTLGGNLRRVSLRHIEAVIRVAKNKKPQTKIFLPNRIILKRVYETLVFSRIEHETTQDFCYFLDRPGVFYLEDLGFTISLTEMEKQEITDMGASLWTSFLDASQLSYPLMIRNFRQGDRFVPLGMSGRKKLKDFFIDLKIPSEKRKEIPILAHQNMPVWICGLRLDDGVKIKATTKKVLKVELIKTSL